MALKKVSILLILSIFGMTVRAWCDPVKSIGRAAIQLTTVKMDANRAIVLKKSEPAKGSPEWLKRNQARARDVNPLRIVEEKKREQWVDSLNQLTYSRGVSENGWRNKLFNSLNATEAKPPSSDSGRSTLKTYPVEKDFFEQEKTFTKLKLLQSREEALKEIFMGIGFSLDLTHGHMSFEMNVTPAIEKRSGFLIRF